jgi:hypothetical protein
MLQVVKYWKAKGQSGFYVWRYLLRRDDPEPAPWHKVTERIFIFVLFCGNDGIFSINLWAIPVSILIPELTSILFVKELFFKNLGPSKGKLGK